MYILAINLSHHASICLLEDGEILFYLENDRLSRLKEEEFRYGDCIEIFKFIFKYTNHVDHLIFCSYGKNINYHNPDVVMIDYFKKQLNNYRITYDDLHFYNEHHLYHATNAFYGSEFTEAAVLVMDGGGTYYNDFIQIREVETMYYFSNLEFEIIKKHYSLSQLHSKDKPVKYDEKTIFSSSLSCGWIFNTMSSLSGNSPGNIMCLSSYGDLEQISPKSWFLYDENTDSWYTDNSLILETYKKYCTTDNIDPCNRFENVFFRDHDSEFSYQTIANIAKKVQKETKEHTIKLIRQLLQKCDTKNIVLSGGYMLNCVNNYEYLKEFPGINFYIDPIAHDGGTSIGAAKYLWHNVLKNSKRECLKTLYLG
jgi:carbamoyltransferase